MIELEGANHAELDTVPSNMTAIRAFFFLQTQLIAGKTKPSEK